MSRDCKSANPAQAHTELICRAKSMNLMVIEGGLGRQPSRRDISHELERRIAESGYRPAKAKSVMTDLPPPAAVHHLKIQLDFAASMLSQLDPIPADFRDDRYWPSFDGSR
jgi:hypothetical protein